ncbi:MAG: hypothetical protein ACW972_11010 [Promethearchaeota archaeon]|jgi:hypothetical protein
MISGENLLLGITTIIASILSLINGILTFVYARKRNNRVIYLFSTNWILQAIFWALDGTAHLTFTPLIMAISFIPHTIGVLCLFIYIELIEKENVSPIMISILVVIEMLFLLFAFFPGGMEVIPNYGVHIVGLCRILQIIFLVSYVFYYFSWSYKTWRKSPPELKRKASVLLLGSILFSIVTVGMYVIGTVVKIFNPLGFVVHGVGAFITVIVIWQEPKLIYVLRFKAYRIIVLETGSGTALFKHDWAELRDIDENFFTMMLQAISSVLNELLHKGEVREVQTDKAVLLVQHNLQYPIASVVIASKSCKSLRYGLREFNDQFVSKYSTDIETNYHNVSRFDDATTLVKNVFDFVPEYQKKFRTK